MKIVLWILTILGAISVFLWLKNRNAPAPGGMITTEQKNAGNNSVLWAYSQIVPPIAMLTRPPLTNVNLRMVDPVLNIPPYSDTINQNGQTA